MRRKTADALTRTMGRLVQVGGSIYTLFGFALVASDVTALDAVDVAGVGCVLLGATMLIVGMRMVDNA